MSWQYPGPARPTAGDMGTLASDGDRDAAVRVLSEALAEGRLTAGEHGERVRAALAARTWPELAGLTADLPGLADTRPAVTAGWSGVTPVARVDDLGDRLGQERVVEQRRRAGADGRG